MSALSLKKKLARREKYVQQVADGFDFINKINQREEILEDSPGALKLMRGIQRRLDSDFGLQGLAKEPPLSVKLQADLERIDFGVSDFGIRATLAAGLIEKLGIQPNDKILVLQGDLKGMYLNVVSLESATELRLEDVASFVLETNVQLRADLSAEKKSYS